MKLKDLLSESYLKVLDRKFGEPLPTIEDTARAYRLKQEELDEKIVPASDKDVKEVASLLGKSANDVQKFVNKYKDLDADDLIDVIEAGDRRRSSLMIMAAMNNNSKALRQLDKLLGFL